MSAQSLLDLLPSLPILTAEGLPHPEQNQDYLRGKRLELMGCLELMRYLAHILPEASSGSLHCFCSYFLQLPDALRRQALAAEALTEVRMLIALRGHNPP